MALLRGFTRVAEDGRIPIPKNIRRAAGLKEGQLVELKVQGPTKAQFVIINKRAKPR